MGGPPKPPPNGEAPCFPGAVFFRAVAPAPNGEAPCFAGAVPCLGEAPNPDPNGEAPCFPTLGGPAPVF